MLELPAQLTQANASACLRDLLGRAHIQPEAVLVKADQLRRFDSAALAVLLSLRRSALVQRKSFTVLGLPKRLAALARLYGIETLLEGSCG